MCNMDMDRRKQKYYSAGVLLRELSSRRRMLRERSFVRIWKERTGKGMCSG